MNRKLLVTHHAPDLDATGSVWLFKRFEAQHYANARVTFVNPGSTLSTDDAAQFEVAPGDVVHVDTGLGEYDHHQPDRGLQHISASSLVYDHLCQVHPELTNDLALRTLVEYITDVDHFGEINWPDASNPRYSFMIHELIRGFEFTEPHDDDSQLHFAMTCLDCAYGVLTQQIKAQSLIAEKGVLFEIPMGNVMTIETKNDDVLKVGQRQGCAIVVKKDSEEGHIRIKARPDVDIDLKSLADEIAKIDHVGTWYYHPSGKMLLNGSDKHRSQKPSPLELEQIAELIKKLYG